MAFGDASHPTSRLLPLLLCSLQVGCARNFQCQGIVEKDNRSHIAGIRVLVDTLGPDSSCFSDASVGPVLS